MIDRLTLTLPQDYAGDGLHFNVRLVNTDTVSSGTKMVEKDVTLSITWRWTSTAGRTAC